MDDIKMTLESENHVRNWRRIKLSHGGTLTLSCSNLFTMTPEERAFILGILEQIEAHERTPVRGDV